MLLLEISILNEFYVIYSLKLYKFELRIYAKINKFIIWITLP